MPTTPQSNKKNQKQTGKQTTPKPSPSNNNNSNNLKKRRKDEKGADPVTENAQNKNSTEATPVTPVKSNPTTPTKQQTQTNGSASKNSNKKSKKQKTSAPNTPNTPKEKSTVDVDKAITAETSKYSVGDFVAVKVTEYLEASKELKVELPDKTHGFIHITHTSDFSQHYRRNITRYAVGTVINQAMVLSFHQGLHLTLKQSLIEAKKQDKLPSEFEDVKPETLYSGFISGKQDYGYFVSFLGKVCGLFPEKNPNAYEIGQSVTAYTEVIDKLSKRIKLTLKGPKITLENPVNYLHHYYTEEEELAKTSKFKGSNWKQYNIGDVIETKVSEIKDFAVVLESSIPNVSIHAPTGTGSLKKGATVKARVVDVVYDKGIIEVSLRKDFVNANVDGKGKIPIGKQVEGVIECVKEHVVVVSYNNGSNLAYCLSKDFNDSRDVKQIHHVGSKVSIIPKMVISGIHNRTLAQFNKEAKAEVAIDKSQDAVTSDVSIKLGAKVKVRVHAIKRFELSVGVIGTRVNGRIHITELEDYSPTNVTNPILKFKKGDTLDAKIIDIVDMQSNQGLSLQRPRANTRSVVWLTLKPSRVNLDGVELGAPSYKKDNLKVGQIVDGIVHKASQEELLVFLSRFAEGRVHVLESSNDLEDLTFMADKYQPGQPVRCKVIQINGNKLDLSIKAVDEKAATSKITSGSVVNGRVVRVDPEAVLVLVGSHQVGLVHLTDIDDVYEKNPAAKLEPNQFVKCFVLAVRNNTPILSLRPSRLTSGVPLDTKNKYYQKEIKSADDLKPGDLVHGYVHQVLTETSKYVLVRVAYNIYTKIYYRDVDDVFIRGDQIVNRFRTGKRVSVRIKSVDDQGHLIGSMKPSDVYQSTLVVEQIKQGHVLTGKIMTVIPAGVTIIIYGTSIKAFCNLENLSDVKVEDPSEIYNVGDIVKGVAIRVDREQPVPIKLCLKESVVSKAISNGRELKTGIEIDIDDETPSEVQQPVKKDKKQKKRKQEESEPAENDQAEEDSEPVNDEGNDDNDADENNDEDNNEESEEEAPPAPVSKKTKAVPSKKVEPEPVDMEEDDDEDVDEDKEDKMEGVTSIPQLKVSVGFGFEEPASNQATSLDDGVAEEDIDEDSLPAEKKKIRQEKKKEKKQKEKEIEEREAERMENKAPQNPSDFEKLLLSSPNSSYVWVKYMAHYISITEIDKARQIAQRALKTIDSAENKEKLNVWIAWLNLENNYGTQQSMNDLFNKALQYNDPKIMYIKLVDIYERSQNVEAAEKVYQTITKKFKESKKTWKKYAYFLVNNGKIGQFRNMIAEALKSLPKRKHVEMISKFGQIEFRYGSADRGRTIFEGIMSNYPKKVDQWSVYLDMEIRNGDKDTIRRLFERVVSLKFSSKKMKFFFKKFLNWEKQNGDEVSIARVKELAQTYVQNVMK